MNRSSATAVRPTPTVVVAPTVGDRRWLLSAVGIVAVVIGVALRWWPRSALWLDEAQSVAFARLPLDEIPHALRTDGAPPAYYMLLHLWMRVFGDGDVAVRSLSALLSTVTLVIVWLLVSRRCGRRVAIAATALLALNPFAIRYGAETRMYALVMLEVVVGLAAVAWSLERPRLGRLAVVTLAGRPPPLHPLLGDLPGHRGDRRAAAGGSGRAAPPPAGSRWRWPPAACSGCRGCRRSASKRPTPARRGRRPPGRRPRSRSSPGASARRRSLVGLYGLAMVGRPGRRVHAAPARSAATDHADRVGGRRRRNRRGRRARRDRQLQRGQHPLLRRGHPARRHRGRRRVVAGGRSSAVGRRARVRCRRRRSSRSSICARPARPRRAW